ncbi:MAG: cytochrome c oxidase accessory protein CcoG [Myxococcota bacterium]|nr:cytochrome c oxidase accessory protein CcoG [Myxococcota bacterium]
MAIFETKPGWHRTYIYPMEVKGRFQTIRKWSMLALQAFFFIMPWVKIGGKRMLMLDIGGRELHIFGAVFTSTDNEFILLILLMSGFALFLFTSLFGRIWCGYACPQTVFLEQWVYPIEEFIEGKRGVRMRRDRKGKGTWDWWWRKIAKWTVWVIMSVILAMTLTSFFVDAATLWTFQASAGFYAAAFVLGAGALADYGWFRDQFCSYLCPYARFQGALTDDESWVIAYDEPRGEPRRRGKRKNDAQGACISCNKCVSVCPQGIDIRDGYQLECISCARCIDACEGVMDKLGEETLVRYTSVAEEAGKKVRWLRPRTMVYGAIMTVLIGIFVALLAGRHQIEASVNRTTGTLYTIDDDGYVRNTYMLYVANRSGDDAPITYDIDVVGEGLEGAEIIELPMVLSSGESKTLPLIVRLPPDDSRPATLPIEVRIADQDDVVVLDTNFKSGK